MPGGVGGGAGNGSAYPIEAGSAWGDPVANHRYLTHAEPVWRERANFILFAPVEDPDSEAYDPSAFVAPGAGGEVPSAIQMFEQLWTRRIRRLGRTRYEVCCIPFFVYDLHLGDVVETEAVAGLRYVVRRIVRRSGHLTLRVWFGESNRPTARDEVPDELAALGCDYEWSSANLLAVSAPSAVQAGTVLERLNQREALGELIVETGWTD